MTNTLTQNKSDIQAKDLPDGAINNVPFVVLDVRFTHIQCCSSDVTFASTITQSPITNINNSPHPVPMFTPLSEGPSPRLWWRSAPPPSAAREAPGHTLHWHDVLNMNTPHLQDAVSPEDVDVPAEGVDGPIRLRHRHHRLGVRVLEGRLPLKVHSRCYKYQ